MAQLQGLDKQLDNMLAAEPLPGMSFGYSGQACRGALKIVLA